MDDNKRTALVASFALLSINGWEVEVEETEAARVFWDLAAGETDETALAGWFRRVAQPLPKEEP